MKMPKSILTVSFAFFMLAGCNMSSYMIHEHESPYSYEKTIEAIQQNAMEQGWKIPKVYDFQQTLLKHEQADPGRIAVVKLCHPGIAARMLGNDNNKFVSAMMPCSIGVYEKADGKTYVSSMNMGLMSKVMGKEVGPILKEVAEEDASILRFLNNE